ncbi:MAG: hypothetical protein A2499_09610 [Stygiobacter sp. RIFOXYC12_FULL_38_8]|nr:MAG: hypothetical protein A2X62_11340 [Stygiobacter sp. GWC2_38_9]OGV08899.1 MAG: hypothetical protein A2299_18970 [Stygiobacter sp. RIFOXYB2_FULL_37_11]OGV15565.1 MAG: hypothetical protein A2440_00730 [Stygiobacter sp. RIFOXYC2_FULL_38_25]OGV16468.1 MAG: hypothetical protein A2237_11275 [Stygiobacter sp. RIFOXYA2_FULL_38_8]OGV26042.1 MAG: hypothetical protein A2499_09610 [Stygiobacter sp. RIFOXYC12_FULL_38_8]OGV80680.1 MAG: hypothetical protein A2X65_05780 [Stygiobacter sp. GWF2_38_21]
MKKSFYLLIVLIFMCRITIIAQTGTFDFETATSSGTPFRVTQTVDSRIVTITSAVDYKVVDPAVEWLMPVGGITGKTAINDVDMTSSIVISFNGPVNIRTLKVYEGNGSNSSGTMTFVPTGGSNSTINYTPSPNQWDNNSKLITLNWIGITAINITAPYSYYWGFDDIVMDASLPVELTSFTGTAYGSIVALDWATATEVNNYGFNVERASMVRQNSPQAQLGMTWEKIAFVQGHGNSNSPKIYSFQDGNPSVGKVQYRLKQIDFNGVFEYSPIVEVKVEAPSQLKLAQNYPNPFNPETTISFQIPFASHVTLKVYDVLGREVATLVDEFKQAGTYVKTLHATSLPSGVYFYKLQTDNGFSETKKLMLMK